MEVNYENFVFSATGNSLYAAKQIGGELISIPQAIKDNRYCIEDEVIGFVFPTYCCNFPKIVKDYLEKAELKAKYMFAIATYGNPAGKGGDGSEMLELRKYTDGLGMHFNYLNSILMIDNFVDMFEIAKELKKEESKKIEEHLTAIKQDIKHRKEYVKDPGFLGKATTALCKGLAENQGKGGTAIRSFTVNDTCIACGTCAKICPRGNIKITDTATFGGSCEGCYACVHACPKNAIHVKRERSEKRFRNQNITLKEIIDANNQE